MLEALLALSSSSSSSTTTAAESEPLLNANADPAQSSAESYGTATSDRAAAGAAPHRRDETAALDAEEDGVVVGVAGEGEEAVNGNGKGTSS